MKTTIQTLIALSLLASKSVATPACPDPCQVVQPDGAVVVVRLRGDEFRHWTEDAKGNILIQTPSGGWEYAPPIVGCKTKRIRNDPAPVKARGRVKNLVLLVDFPDKPHLFPKSSIRAVFNRTEYRQGGAAGSVKDFYREVSYGKLTIDSVVTDWIRLDQSYAYYGADAAGMGMDQRPREMVSEALAKLAAGGFDFGTADADGDGEVDLLTVVHAGGGQEFSMNDTRYIWSHQWALSKAVTYGGKRLRRYATVPERRGLDHDPATQGLTRIGVICHEMGHLLGLPDLYDPDFDSRGVGRFCLMGYGAWNGSSGTLPAHPSVWCKSALRWLTPRELTDPGVYRAPRAEIRPRAFRLSGSFPRSEYFLMENRQGVGFDSGLPGERRGLLIWHIDETVEDNDNPRHYRVDLVEASGAQQLENNRNNGNDKDYFRAGHNAAFGGSTTPSSRGYGGQPLGLAIEGISGSSAVMRFSVRNEQPLLPGK